MVFRDSDHYRREHEDLRLIGQRNGQSGGYVAVDPERQKKTMLLDAASRDHGHGALADRGGKLCPGPVQHPHSRSFPCIMDESPCLGKLGRPRLFERLFFGNRLAIPVKRCKMPSELRNKREERTGVWLH